MLRIFYLTVLVIACQKEQPRRPVVGSGEEAPCAQYADGVCPLYDADAQDSNNKPDNSRSTMNSPNDEVIEQSANRQLNPDEEPSEKSINSKDIAIYSGFVLQDKALYPLFLADDLQQPISEQKFRYGGSGFKPSNSPENNGLPFSFELLVTLQFVLANNTFCARSSLDKRQLLEFLQWENQQLQADESPLAKERGGYPKLQKMNVKEGACP